MADENPYQLRVPPMGPVVGNPPVNLSSNGTNGTLTGVVWRYQGAGPETQVPGSSAGDALGLVSLPVNIKPIATGYRYDVRVDMLVNNIGTAFGEFNIIVLGSTDNGATFTETVLDVTSAAAFKLPSAGVEATLTLSCALRTLFANADALPIDHIKVQLQNALSEGPDLTYWPGTVVVSVDEYSSV